MGEYRHPKLHRLSADSSFLLQLPYLRAGQPVEGLTHPFFNILIDPWLSGGQVNFLPIVSTFWHRERPAASSIRDVVALISRSDGRPDGLGSIDAVFILHQFTDHMHQESLLQLHREIPVFATPDAASIIHSWGYFARVAVIPDFPITGSWEGLSTPLLPSWLNVSRLSQHDIQCLHSALLITFSSGMRRFPSAPSQSGSQHSAIIYTPHGISPRVISAVQHADPAIEPLCLIHGLDSVHIAGPLLHANLGVCNAVAVLDVCKAKYWVACHDERKTGGGLIGAVLTQEDGKEVARKKGNFRATKRKARANGREGQCGVSLGELGYVELENGEMLELQ